MQEKIQLPPGTWVTFSYLAEGTTDVALQEFFASCGLSIPLERISIRVYNDGVSAVVSFEQEMFLMLINWAINGAELGGRPVVAMRKGKVCPSAR